MKGKTNHIYQLGSNRLQRKLRAIEKLLENNGRRKRAFSRTYFVRLTSDEIVRLSNEASTLRRKMGTLKWNPYKLVNREVWNGKEYKKNLEFQGPYVRAIHGDLSKIKDAA